MHNTEGPKGPGDILQQAQQIADAATNGTDNAYGPFTLTVCDVDLPAFIWDGDVYIQAPLQGFFDAVAACVSDSIGDLEARISEARRAALASDYFRLTLPVTRVVESVVVRDSGEQR
jgi:hypothetical protein